VALGIKSAPGPQTLSNGVIRRAIVRSDSGRTLRGFPLGQAPFSTGLIWRSDRSIGRGTGNLLAGLAVEAHHPHLAPAALSLPRARGRGGWGADSGTGAAMAAGVKRLSAQLGRPAAYLKDGGRELQKAVDLLAKRGRASPCSDDISHAAAGRRHRSYHPPPAVARVVSACGRVSGQLQQPLLACLAPPAVRPTARFMKVPRLFPWAERRRKLAPASGAKAGAILARLRACRDALPACQDLIQRFRADAQGLLGCQQILTTPGLCPHTRAQCEPLIDAPPSAALRREFRAYLAFQLDIAKTLGLDPVGLPISSDTIEALFGGANHLGGGQPQEAARRALRLPALGGGPTREEAHQVLGVSVARQQALTAQFTSLTKQRRAVLRHPEPLESRSLSQGGPHVVLLPSPKNQSNHQSIVNISPGCKNPYGPQFGSRHDLVLIESARSPDFREAALTS